MQKKIIALAVAGLSTAAFAQTNVTIYGVADVSAQGTNMSSGKALNYSATSGQAAAGGAFNLVNNSSLIGFKGTEALGNGVNALFQFETNVAIQGGAAGASLNTSSSNFSSLRDSYVGVSSKYGTVLGGYMSTPYRSALTSFDVMPGATGAGRNENMIGKISLNSTNLGAAGGIATSNTNAANYVASARATALAYALPTMYGFNGSIAYTGTNNNGQTDGQANLTTGTYAPQGALSMNLGWTGYGVNVQGAYQQAKVNQTAGLSAAGASAATLYAQGYTSYLVGASYTGIPGLKAALVYGRNSLGTNGTSTVGAQKGSNNQIWAGVSYRFGNNEPRLSWASSSNTNGLQGVGQDGGRQWTANWGYYLSKRTQVYGLVSAVNNNANGVFAPAASASGSALAPTGGQNFVTYGAGLRTNF